MIIQILADGVVTLEDPDTFTAFHVDAMGQDLDAIQRALGAETSRTTNEERVESHSEAHENGPLHVWIPIARLHALGAAHGGPQWRAGCDAMIEFARSKGWVDEAGQRVRAHLEA